MLKLTVEENTIKLGDKEYKNLFQTKKQGIEIIASKKALNGNFTIVKNKIIDAKSIPPSGRLLYIFLLKFAFRKGHCFASYETISKGGWSRKSVYNRLRELEKAGWIETIHQGLGKPNIYYLKL